MQIKPINEHNAIDACVFILKFAAPLDEATGQRVDEALADALPGRRQMQGIVVQIVSSPSNPPALITRFKAKPDGSDAWAVLLNGAVLSIACREYDRYSNVWEKAKEHLEATLTAIASGPPIIEASLQIVDRFTLTKIASDNEENVYKPELVFADNSKYLTPHVATSGPLWHVHQGWFRNDNGNTRILIQLNLSNAELAPARDWSTAIDYRGSASTQSTNATNAVEKLEPLFKKLHDINHELVAELLNADMRAAIGMQEP